MAFLVNWLYCACQDEVNVPNTLCQPTLVSQMTLKQIHFKLSRIQHCTIICYNKPGQLCWQSAKTLDSHPFPGKHGERWTKSCLYSQYHQHLIIPQGDHAMVRAWRPLGPESSGRLVKVCHNTGHDINKLINDTIWELPVINQNVEVVPSTTITRTWTTEDSIKTTKNWQDVKMVKQQQINNNSKSTTASQQQQQQQHCLFWKQWKWSNKKKHNKTETISTTESTASHKKVDSNICFWH